MITKAELITQFKIENPKIIQIINGEEIELSKNDYETNAEAWAEMRFQQITLEEEKTAAANAKTAILDRLGITADEAKLILS